MALTRYKPKRWQPEFDLIILGSISGKSNLELAESFGFTPQHISNILNTPQAEELKNKVRDKIAEDYEEDLGSVIAEINKRAIKHLRDFVKDSDELRIRSPFDFIDRTIKIAQVGGVVKNPNGGGGTTINQQFVNLPSTMMDEITKSLSLANEVDSIHNSAIDRSKEVKLLPSDVVIETIVPSKVIVTSVNSPAQETTRKVG